MRERDNDASRGGKKCVIRRRVREEEGESEGRKATETSGRMISRG